MPIKRKTSRSRYLHVCQKSADNGIIFNVIEDYLVLFTILCVKASAYGVVILAIAIMFNHFHLGAFFPLGCDVSGFMNASTSVFARIYNSHYCLKGRLFKKPFKSAPKVHDRKIRDNLFYIWNNPVEKKAVKSAEEYRWNFMKYMDSDHPFSEPVNPAEASDKLLGLMRKVAAKQRAGEYLDYGFFDGDYRELDRKESLQLVDYIVVTYSVINNDKVLEKLGDYQSIVLASRSVTGSEYDLEDDSDEEDYRHYRQMMSIVKREGIDLRKVRFNRAFFEQHEELYGRFRRLFKTEAGASEYEIAKFLHLL